VRKLLLIMLSLLTHTGIAATPENGWWWNPDEPGRGFNIETQNGIVFIATFVYDDAGNPIWYSGSGALNHAETVTMDLFRTEGGPCFGCLYTPPQSLHSGNQLTAQFDSESTATVFINGVKHTIERFDFNLGAGLQRLLGIWSIVLMEPHALPSATLGIGDTIGYISIMDDIAIGFRTSDPRWSVVAKPLEGGETYLSTAPISTNKKLVLFFSFTGLNRIEGITAIVDVNANSEEISSALGSGGVFMVGFRYLSPAEIETASSAKQVPNSNNETDILATLEEIEEVASLIKEKGLTPTSQKGEEL
jgi:hypothetical protein